MKFMQTGRATAILAASLVAAGPIAATAQGVTRIEPNAQSSTVQIPAASAAIESAAKSSAPETPVASSLPDGTRLYLSLDEPVSSARGGVDVGSIVRCRVWRDVEVQGVLFIKAGTPATCRVDKVSRRNIGGFEGKVSVGGVETKSVDGQTVMLSGGYNKEGSGHKAVVLTIGLLLFWPALFVPGGNAELAPGTVFDVATVNELKLQVAAQTKPTRVVDLRSLANGLSTEFMIDDFVNQPKHDVFRIKVAKEGQLPPDLVIDSVNGKTIDAIPLTIKNPVVNDGQTSAIAEVSAKSMASHFVRGINRFEIAYKENGQRQSSEVVMDVQM